MSSPPPTSPPHSLTSSPIRSSNTTPSPKSSPQTSLPSTSHSATSNSNSASTSSSSAPLTPADPSTTTTFTIPRSIEGSEQPLIARTHYTNGYRAGISAGKDDPEIAQGGFDEGFPLGAALAVTVGYLLEVVKVALLRDDAGGGGADGGQGDVGSVDADVQVASRDTRVGEAERELSLECLVQEMEANGLLQAADECHDLRQRVSSLPAIAKWTRFVEARGFTASPG